MTPSPVPYPGFSTPRMTELFSPHGLVGALLSFEAALALALADAGRAPRHEAEAVAQACQQPLSDPEGIMASTWEAGTPLIALIEEIGRRLSSDAERRWVHYGATTQDAIDTAHMLQARAALEDMDAALSRIAGLMKELVERYRDQPQIGRTFLQHALPTTFGTRVAQWLDATLRHIVQLRETSSGLVVQLGGPVGNLAAFGAHGTDVVAALARRLELEAPSMAWHADRSRIWSLAEAVERAVATMAKVAMDVALLAQTDTAELKVRAGASSSISDKRNPIDAVRALAAAGVCGGAAAMLAGTRPHELDRAAGSWHVEWLALPLLFQSGSAVFEATARCLDTMEIDGEQMASRVSAGQRQELEDLDPRQIDLVLSLYERVVTGA